ncbi:natriuretic peptide A-like [Denticeps clupeoides]|uniref:natriuretic peptide A-like n=1 Tax=Denticeps clupeoides TaxID=299321 RepID=UPI0010A57FB7|nr:C-type natriuretic peptide 3-like [Denticeps clupeoides]
MVASISLLCVSSLLLLNVAAAKPVTNLQSLERLLLEDMTGERSPEAAESREDGGFARLLGDILTTSKRSWSRFKKGGLRSCFGVRLERIGSFSGLGC